MFAVKRAKFPHCLSRRRIAADAGRVPPLAQKAPSPCPRVRMGSFFL